jgi:hypothetical protein
MQVIASAEGRRRIWYRADEIEQICVSTLEAAGLIPDLPRCDVDIEGLVEAHLGAEVDYGVTMPEDVLGYTEFRDPPLIAVSRALTDAATASGAAGGIVGRWRATIAHEAAHVILHAPLFTVGADQPGQPNSRPIRCPRTSFEAPTSSRDWREVQANMGMAALLMPRELFDREAADAFLRRGTVMPPVSASEPWLDIVVAVLASRFKVSKQAARIRLQVMGYIA